MSQKERLSRMLSQKEVLSFMPSREANHEGNGRSEESAAAVKKIWTLLIFHFVLFSGWEENGVFFSTIQISPASFKSNGPQKTAYCGTRATAVVAIAGINGPQKTA